LFYQHISLFIFFSEKENEPKEIALPCGPSGCPVLLKTVGRCETRYVQTVTAPFSTAFAMLGAWQRG